MYFNENFLKKLPVKGYYPRSVGQTPALMCGYRRHPLYYRQQIPIAQHKKCERSALKQETKSVTALKGDCAVYISNIVNTISDYRISKNFVKIY